MNPSPDTLLETSQPWRTAHIVIFCFATAASVASFKAFKVMDNTMQSYAFGKCLFYAKPTVYLGPKSPEGKAIVCTVDLTKSKWGKGSDCNFVTFAILASIVYGIISVWFFSQWAIIKGDDGESVDQSRKLVLPATLLSTVLTFLTFSMAWKMSGGLDFFFSSLEVAHKENCTQNSTDVPWGDSSLISLHNQRLYVQLFGWLTVTCWVTATVVLLTRCFKGLVLNNETENARVIPPSSTQSSVLPAHTRTGVSPEVHLETPVLHTSATGRVTDKEETTATFQPGVDSHSSLA